MTLEHNLEDGRMVTLNVRRRDPDVEERFNIVPRNIYGVTIAGINPQIGVGYVGRLQRVTMHVCNRGFVLDSIELRNGYVRDDSTRLTPFDREELSLRNARVTAFGFMDEEIFRRTRESLYENRREE